MPRVPYSPQKPFLLKRLHLSAACSVPRHESSWCSPKKGLVLMDSHVDQHDHGTLLNTIYTQPQTPLWVNPLEGLEGSVHYLLSHSAYASYDARPGVLFRLIASHPIRDSCSQTIPHKTRENLPTPPPRKYLRVHLGQSVTIIPTASSWPGPASVPPSLRCHIVCASVGLSSHRGCL